MFYEVISGTCQLKSNNFFAILPTKERSDPMIFCWATWNQSYFLVFVKTRNTEVHTYVLSASSQSSPGLPAV